MRALRARAVTLLRPCNNRCRLNESGAISSKRLPEATHMNLRSLVSLAVVLAMPLTACVITPRTPGDVTFLWSFGGNTCAMVPAIANVKITVSGQTLQNDGIYPCSTNGTAGIVLNDFKGGLYSYTIQGRD